MRRLVVSGTFTVEPIEPPLKFMLDAACLEADLEFAPFNQVFQELLNPHSLSATNRTGVNVFLIRWEDWIRPDAHESVEMQLQRNSDELVQAAKSFADRGAKMLIVLCPGSRAFRENFPSHDDLVAEQLRAVLNVLPNVSLVTKRDLETLYPVADYDDPVSDRLGHVPYTSEFYAALAIAITRRIYGMVAQPHKVLVLDCDNTLWSGIVGEDGVENLVFGAPQLAVQRLAVEQVSKGMLVCLCSRNNEEDVWRVFAERKDLLLKRDHVIASRINWLPKSQNLRALAEELNLGLDSFVFIDDDAAVCAEVRAQLPEVLTLHLPADEAAIPGFLSHTWAFDKAAATKEDAERTQMYREGLERDRLRKSSSNLSEFLAGLEIKIQIQEMREADLGRVAQLTQRTNQFNFTTIRRTEAEVNAFLRDGGKCRTVSVRDRFGDYGLVGILLFRSESDAVVVDSFLLSCRALGRGVEHRMLAELGEFAVKEKLSWVDLSFARSAKNQPARDFVADLGAKCDTIVEGVERHRLTATQAASTTYDVNTLADSSPESTNAVTAAPNAPTRRVPLERLARDFQSAAALEALMSVARIVDGESRTVRSNDDLDATTGRLLNIWRNLLGIDQINLDENFFDLGGTSLLGVRLFARIEAEFGKQLPLTTLFNAATVRQIAELLGEVTVASGAYPSLVAIQPLGSRAPFFCVHAAGGNVLFYGDLARWLGNGQPFYAFQPQGLNGQAGRHDRVEDMAAHYIREMRELQPFGPYHLGGSSFGGLVAYEMARQLDAAGEKLDLVALFDTYGPGYPKYLPGMSPWRYHATRAISRVKNHLISIAKSPGRRRFIYIRNKAVKAWNQLRKKQRTRQKERARARYESAGQELPPELKRAQLAISEALASYQYPAFRGRITLFRATSQPIGIHPDETLGWRDSVKGGIEIHEVPGHHGALTVDPYAERVARILDPLLARSKWHAESQA